MLSMIMVQLYRNERYAPACRVAQVADGVLIDNSRLPASGLFWSVDKPFMVVVDA